jgi:hypothetical protein
METQAEVDDYFNQYSYTFPIAYDPEGNTDWDYKIDFIPQTWVLDADGVIVEYFAGAVTYTQFKSAIEKALR